MLDTIILLMGPVERPVLTLVLQGHNPRLSVQAVATSVELAALRPRSLRSARLIAFCTDTLVPAAVLHRLAFGAYNFHPGPPRFPGWGAAHFAVHRGATEFGATAHVMVDKVDAGAIVGVERFWIPPGSTALQLEEMAYAGAARLFWRLARPLA
ncbi:MAG TPA: formyltransferase family protein, partial [Xanthobacteraceae bacterium]